MGGRRLYCEPRYLIIVPSMRKLAASIGVGAMMVEEILTHDHMVRNEGAASSEEGHTA